MFKTCLITIQVNYGYCSDYLQILRQARSIKEAYYRVAQFLRNIEPTDGEKYSISSITFDEKEIECFRTR